MRICPSLEIARLARARRILQRAAERTGRLELADAAAILDAWIGVWWRLR